MAMMSCHTCEGDIDSDDEAGEWPSIVKNELRFCYRCWDENACHRCFHYDPEPSYLTCSTCDRRVHVECCVAFMWCQSHDVICKDCIPQDRETDTTCRDCHCVTPIVFPQCVDGNEDRCPPCRLAYEKKLQRLIDSDSD